MTITDFVFTLFHFCLNNMYSLISLWQEKLQWCCGPRHKWNNDLARSSAYWLLYKDNYARFWCFCFVPFYRWYISLCRYYSIFAKLWNVCIVTITCDFFIFFYFVFCFFRFKIFCLFVLTWQSNYGNDKL